MTDMAEQFRAFEETTQIWLLSFLDLWQARPEAAEAFLDRLGKDD